MPHLQKVSYQAQKIESSLKIKALACDSPFFLGWPKVGHVLWIRWGIALIALERWGMQGAGWLHSQQGALYRGALGVSGGFMRGLECLY
jgi:hypothetical protein